MNSIEYGVYYNNKIIAYNLREDYKYTIMVPLQHGYLRSEIYPFWLLLMITNILLQLQL